MKKNFLQKNKRRQRGFTLMEALVAIFILLLATTGPMVFTQNSLRSAFLSRDQIVAFYLAQDVFEYVKNYRDGTFICIVNTAADSDNNCGNWIGEDNKFKECFDEGGCSIDTLSDDVKACGSDVPGCVGGSLNVYTPLNYDADRYYTNAADGTPSIFARHVNITNINDDEVEVKATIRWKSHEGIGVREIIVKENIFNLAHALAPYIGNEGTDD